MPPRSNVVLIVEDEPLIAMSIEDVVERAGLVPHTCRTMAAALEFARLADLRGAVLDYWIHGHDASELAKILAARSIPFVVATGSDPVLAAPAFAGAPVLRKPYADAALLACLEGFDGRS